jgi:hypothetical protein
VAGQLTTAAKVRGVFAQLARLVAQLLLLAAGVVLIALALAIWLTPELATVATVREESKVSVVGPAATPAATATQAQTAGGNPGSASQTTETTTDKTTTTTTPPAAKRSDVLLTTVLAIGAAAVLIGLFLSRITSIKVAGVELALATQIAAIVAQQTKPTTAVERAKTSLATLRAVREAEKLGTSDPAVLEQVTAEALETTFAPAQVPPP